MKRIVILWVVALFATVSSAQTQKDVTQFLGIPVDGYKPEMIKKLKDKGYTVSLFNEDVLVGEFNGRDVTIHIVTNNNKVYRIAVTDVTSISEVDIKIRFNKLCRQFKDNKKYMPASLSESDYTIPEDEDIDYGMSVENKRYEAAFYQLPAESDANYSKKLVWFLINERYGEYYITMFYDNEYNRANGEDL